MGKARHYTSLSNGRAVFQSELGSVTRVNAQDLPILDRLSIKRLVLAPGSVRAPHWHANCSELGYCVRGRTLVTVLGNAGAFSSFLIESGQMFVVESGALHAIDNVGDTEAELILAFGHQLPEDFLLQSAFGAMSDAVLGNTFGLPASAFSVLPHTTDGAYLVRRDGPATVPPNAAQADPHKFDIEAQSAPIQFGYGSARLARNQFWPALKDLSMYSLRVSRNGMREPHWHPATAEMGYVLGGHAKMTILDPDGTTDTWEMAPGDVYFIPRAYPHHIEVLEADEIHFLIFFDQPTPGDIGFLDSVTAFPPAILSAALGLKPESLPSLPKTYTDPLIVERRNPQGHFDRDRPA